ncbi:putative rrna processing protein rrp17 protein [Botrytis fragariae]|uniref:Putative rrna processing protein rrp17 protein n=1 Tax=Botrytis fragariae TaxID=1964551 RepID=A0A8H6AXT3_9HELO|nr:putative rrna processing protein rrp17 protein [Botrytis fragariae]KAF5875494.1 putative rrna processing protein rrp17 protein [Botrytis fragariae]
MESSFIVKPRPKRSVLPAHKKKRKFDHKIEEINFDLSAREDYLTGFHKRKVQRAKRAQEEAEKKAKEERIVMRKQLREERRAELNEHVKAVNALLEDVEERFDGGDGDEWGGIEEEEAEEEAPELVDHEEEYIDEDKYTTVTVEGIEISKDGIKRTADEEDSDDGIHEAKGKVIKEEEKVKKVWPKKPRKKKFTYETKAERKMTRQKQKSGSRAAADARRGNN